MGNAAVAGPTLQFCISQPSTRDLFEPFALTPKRGKSEIFSVIRLEET